MCPMDTDAPFINVRHTAFNQFTKGHHEPTNCERDATQVRT